MRVIEIDWLKVCIESTNGEIAKNFQFLHFLLVIHTNPWIVFINNFYCNFAHQTQSEILLTDFRSTWFIISDL